VEDMEHDGHPSPFEVDGMSSEVAEHYVVTELKIFRLLSAGDYLARGGPTLAGLGNGN
jgi:hypothetical protein